MPELLRAVTEQGYTEPTPIQAQAIPVVLSGRDLLGAAQTGTGKTAGFTLPLLQRLAPLATKSFSPALHPVRCLILTPTRELAIQVHESVKAYGKHVLSFLRRPPNARKLKVVVDAANGMGTIYKPFLEQTGIELIPLYFELQTLLK